MPPLSIVVIVGALPLVFGATTSLKEVICEVITFLLLLCSEIMCNLLIFGDGDGFRTIAVVLSTRCNESLSCESCC